MNGEDPGVVSWNDDSNPPHGKFPDPAGGATVVGTSRLATLPRGLVISQGYLELATGAASLLGVSPAPRRRMLRKALTAAVNCQVPPPLRTSRQLQIGQALRLLGRYRPAITALRRASFDRRLRRDALLGLAWCQRRQRDLSGAITSITRALAVAPDDGDLHYNLACYLALVDETRSAIYELAWALELKPRLRPRAAREPDFDSLRGAIAFETLTRATSA